MKNVLKYFYNLSFEEIKEYGEYSILQLDNKVYVFKKYVQDEEETKYIINMLFNNQIYGHTIIINNQDSMTTDYNGSKYVLLLINNLKMDIKDDFFYIETPKKEINMGKLWSDKIDYYMRQISELSLGKTTLINTFNYYIGMAENAISMYNRANKLSDEVKYSINHRRIGYPNYAINYLDPTNMIIDVRIRDVAEYIKARFFNDKLSIKETSILIERYNFNVKEMHFLYARLFYPTYYFDIFEDNIVNEIEEKKIISILEKHKDYEKFLNDFYNYYKTNYALYEIEWVKKLPKVQH